MLLNQVGLQASLMHFCIKVKKPCTVREAEDAVYRLRAMMSQLRKVRMDARRAPASFEALNTILDAISYNAKAGSESEAAAADDGSVASDVISISDIDLAAEPVDPIEPHPIADDGSDCLLSSLFPESALAAVKTPSKKARSAEAKETPDKVPNRRIP